MKGLQYNNSNIVHDGASIGSNSKHNNKYMLHHHRKIKNRLPFVPSLFVDPKTKSVKIFT